MIDRWWSSLTVRLVLASCAWTLGLLPIAHLLSLLRILGPAETTARFGHRIGATVLLAAAMMGVGALLVRHTIKTFATLRLRVQEVRDGSQRRVTGTYLREVQPAVSALNALLDHQDRRVQDALAKAGDLAHGLKTPLAVLTHEAERLARGGDPALAETMTQQLERMRRQIDYHLAHARAAASGATPGARCIVAQSAQAIVRTLERLHAGRGLTFDVAVPPVHAARVQREDLDELLGNLLDNACKWAHARVRVTSRLDAGRLCIVVEDDGTGIAPEMRAFVLLRGVRADEAAPGSGLGLAIVRELAELYGGGIALGDSRLGGLGVELHLPAASSSGSDAVQVQ